MYSFLIPTPTPKTTTTYLIVILTRVPLALGGMKRIPKRMVVEAHSKDWTTRETHKTPNRYPQRFTAISVVVTTIRPRHRIIAGILVSRSILTALVNSSHIASDGPSRTGRVAIICDMVEVTYVATV